MAFVRSDSLQYRRFGETAPSVFDSPVMTVNRPLSRREYIQQPYSTPQQEYIQQPYSSPYITPTPRRAYMQPIPLQPGMVPTPVQPPYSYRPPAPPPIPVQRQEEGDSVWPGILIIVGITVLTLGGYFTYSYVQTQNRKSDAKKIKEDVLDKNAKRSNPGEDGENDDKE